MNHFDPRPCNRCQKPLGSGAVGINMGDYYHLPECPRDPPRHSLLTVLVVCSVVIAVGVGALWCVVKIVKLAWGN